MPGELSKLPLNWATWVAENLALGASPETIRKTLEENGLTCLPSAEMDAMRASPEMLAAMKIAERLQRVETLLLAKSSLDSLRTSPTVPRENGLSAADFFQNYYFCNKPVVMPDLCCQWPRLLNWTPTLFSRRFGDVEIEVQTGRSADRDYELNLDSHRTRLRLAEFVARIETCGESNDLYLCANNRVLEQGLRPLFDEIPALPDLIGDEHSPAHTFLWFGPKGTVTPLHYDLMNLLLVQVSGRKEIVLGSPDLSPLLYNNRGVFSDVDYLSPDLLRYPLFEKARFVTLTLAPGETLFIPVGWWHWVRALDTSISLSFTKFMAPNDFGGQYA